MKLQLQLACIVVVMCWSLLGTAQYYISPSGVDTMTGNCSQSSPCKTFGYVETNFAKNGGETIYVMPGLYRLSTALNSTSGYIAAKNGQTFTGTTACKPIQTGSPCAAVVSGGIQLCTTYSCTSLGNGNYSVTGMIQSGPVDSNTLDCDFGWPGCVYPEALYVTPNGTTSTTPLQHLSSAVSITSFTGTSGTLTFSANNNLAIGSQLMLSGFTGTNNMGLNNQMITVLSTGLSGSQFEATVTGTGYSCPGASCPGTGTVTNASMLALLNSNNWWFDYPNNTIYFHVDPSTATIETSVLATMFNPTPNGGLQANNVTVENLTIMEFAAHISNAGAIDPWYNAAPVCKTPSSCSSYGGDAWTVENNYIALNSGKGVRVGYDMLVKNNVTSSNGNLGIGGGTPAAYKSNTITPSGVRVQSNSVEHNNFAHVSPGFGAGGIKFGNVADLIVQQNNVSNNLGNGIHFDVNSWNPLIEGNTVNNNLDTWPPSNFSASGTGIVCEISEGDCTIRNNAVTFIGRGGTYGLQSSTSVGGDIYCNVVTEPTNGHSNSLWQVNGTNRGPNTTYPHIDQEALSTGNFVHRNTLIWAEGQTGLVGYRLNTYTNTSIVETNTTVAVTSALPNPPPVNSTISMQIYGAVPTAYNGVWQATGSSSSTYTFTAPSGLGTANPAGTSTDQPNFFSVNTAPNYNTYHVPTDNTSGAFFVYDTTNPGENTPEEWATYHEVETNGTFDTNNTDGFPTVTITSPADQWGSTSTITLPATIDTTASDSKSGIQEVDFYLADSEPWTLLPNGAVKTSPYNYTWQSASSGTHTIAAMAISNAPTIQNCAAITLNVK